MSKKMPITQAHRVRSGRRVHDCARAPRAGLRPALLLDLAASCTRHPGGSTKTATPGSGRCGVLRSEVKEEAQPGDMSGAAHRIGPIRRMCQALQAEAR